VGSLRRVIGVIRPRPVAVDERHHGEHLEFKAGWSVAFCLREGLSQERADVLEPAMPQVSARLRQQDRRPHPRNDGRGHVTGARHIARISRACRLLS